MNKHFLSQFFERAVAASALAVLGCGMGLGLVSGTANASSVEEQVNGLWYYTDLVSSDGTQMPLTGVFLFKDGKFMQQSIFNGDPFEAQGAMAHAGPVRMDAASVHLFAEQTLFTAPRELSPLKSAGKTEHDVTVKREGDELTLTFDMGKGTVQEFRRVGPGEGEMYAIENGALAFVDDHFILVEGDEESSVSGYGTFEKDGNALTLKVIRWTNADQSSVANFRDVTWTATFDGKTFRLQDGRSFAVTPN